VFAPIFACFLVTYIVCEQAIKQELFRNQEKRADFPDAGPLFNIFVSLVIPPQPPELPMPPIPPSFHVFYIIIQKFLIQDSLFAQTTYCGSPLVGLGLMSRAWGLLNLPPSPALPPSLPPLPPLALA